MDLTPFVDSIFGSATTSVGLPTNFVYYRPNVIPRDISLSTEVISEMIYAEAKIGELRGMLRHIPQASALSDPFIYKEAIASTHIEGTQASLEEVLQDNLNPHEPKYSVDNQEVRNYIAALHAGIDYLETIPISSRFVRKVHQILLQSGSGVRGEEKLPGQFRSSPVWIGTVGQTLSTAHFVPPIPELIGDLIADWENYVNDQTLRMPLLKAALAHYQFETIHPFLDGNGRVGRLMISFILQQEDLMPSPLLYLSGYFDAYRDDYYSSLAGVHLTGDIDTYLKFFFTAVREQAIDAIWRAEKLVNLRENYHKQSANDRSRITALIPLIMENQIINAQYIRKKLCEDGNSISTQGVHRLLARAQELGWIIRYGIYGKGGSTVFRAQEILDILNAPPQDRKN